MTVSLGGIVLSDDLVLEGLETARKVAYSSRRTLAGRHVLQVGPPLNGGRILSLQSENHITHAELLAIKAVEAVGAVVTLVHHRGVFSVLITAIELEPDSSLANPADDSTDLWYSGTINLLEV